MTEQERQFLRDMLLQVARELPNISCPDCLVELYEYRNELQAMLQQPALLLGVPINLSGPKRSEGTP